MATAVAAMVQGRGRGRGALIGRGGGAARGGGTAAAVGVAGGVACRGVSNYYTNENNALLPIIRSVLPWAATNESWLQNYMESAWSVSPHG